MAITESTWEDIAKAKREAIDDSIPQQWRIGDIPYASEKRDVTGAYVRQWLTDGEIEITEMDATDIVEKTCSGIWSSEEVTRAFCHRASIAHQLVNCLLETFFDAAIEDAKKLDKYLTEHHTPIGPLHGLPISLKDQFHVKGVETSMGYVGWIGTFQGQKGLGRERVFESEMVKELRSLGAILFCKTSVPHTLMSGETSNNIIGYTWNPKNRNLSAGGSSGGEGALIALRGSPAGFGTDIGGSIRIPAAFNGLFGLRPSSGRLPYQGMSNSMDGQNTVLSVVGPMSHSVASLELLIQGLLSQKPWLHDPLVHEIPWRTEQEQEMIDLIAASQQGFGKMAFGVLQHDGFVTPHPPVQRAIGIVTETLKNLGHEVIEWKPPEHRHGVDLCFKTWMFDGGRDISSSLNLSGEPMIPQIAAGYGQAPFEAATASEIAAINVAKREYQKEYMEYWNSSNGLTNTGRPVEAFIMPVAPFPAARPEKFKYYGYTTICNVLDYTSCTVPVTCADKGVDIVQKDFNPLSDLDRDIMDTYDPEIFHGAHVGVQVVGRRLQEEKILVLAGHIGEAVKARSHPHL